MIKQISVETKDYLKTKKDNPGIAIYEIHDPKWNIARRRRGKSSYFSQMA